MCLGDREFGGWGERRNERRGKDAKLIVRENEMIVTNDI